MAKAKTTEAEAPETVGNIDNEAPERVDIYVPRGSANDEPDMFISVNGVNYLLPKGQTHNVPKAVADEFYRSLAAQEELDKKMQAMIDEANRQH